MKRFFCTKCQRVKRVRRFPSVINMHVAPPTGVCDYHALGHVHPFREAATHPRMQRSRPRGREKQEV